MNKHMTSLLTELGIYQSTTGGNDPKSNGLAERYIGIIKHKAAALLGHAELSLSFWYWAAMQVAYVYRSKVLNAPMPKNAPTFGDRVLVRSIEGEKRSFDERCKEAIFLCWTTEVTNGAVVAILPDGFFTSYLQLKHKRRNHNSRLLP